MALTKPQPGSVNAPLGTQGGTGVNLAGGYNILTAQFLSSDVVTAGIVVYTCVNGPIYIDNIVIKTDATGLAGGTNFQVKSNDAAGQAVILAETVANLGANATVDLFTASVTKQRAVVGVGKTISVASTVAACTGAGVVTMHIIYKPLNQIGALQ